MTVQTLCAASIDARGLDFRALNDALAAAQAPEIILTHVLGQRYLGDASSGRRIVIHGTPGNALGAYLGGSEIEVFGNAQDAVGDTMNAGSIIVHGSCGDAAGYAMRGGRILIQGDAGYRAGIHMKAYRDKIPQLVIGGAAGSFLGEYQAGGEILVLNLEERKSPVGYFCGPGMHGGRIYLRGVHTGLDLPKQVLAQIAAPQALEAIRPALEAFCTAFGGSVDALLGQPFTLLTPDTKNPYRQLYTVL